MGFNDYEKKILKKLMAFSTWLSTLQVSKLTKYAWETVQSTLEGLEGDGYVINKQVGDKNLWKFNFRKYRELKEEMKS